MMLRPLSEADIPRVVEIHLQNLKEDFIAGLGRRFLERAVYPTLLHPASGGFGFVQVREGRVVGFIAGALSTPSWHWVLFSRRGLECWAAALRKSLRGWDHLWSVVRKAPVIIAGPKTRPGGEILFLAIDEPYQGKGLAFGLIGAFLEHCRSSRLSCCSVRTSRANVAARCLFKKFGFRPLREVVLSDRLKSVYRLDLDPP
jgi:GNAT superfamily N-acetyltransferase